MEDGRECEQSSQEQLEEGPRRGWQFAAAAPSAPVQAGGDLGLQEEDDDSSSLHVTASPHWLFTAAWAATATAEEGECSDRDDLPAAWTISTASMPQEALSSCEHAAQGMDGSDPLVSKAQELVAAAAASTTPGVHAPLADSAALLNSGAVLLLGQGSTTMCGTNTAASVEASAGGTILSPDECRSHVLSSPQHTSTLQQESPAAQCAQHQQSLASCRRAATRASRRRANRRRQGLLVDSQAGMQQLVAAVHAFQQSPQEKPAMHAERNRQQRLQPPHQQQSAVLSSLQGLSVKQSEDDSQSVPASGDVLVLGGSCSTSSRPDATPAAADATQAAVPPAEGEAAAAAAGDGAGRGDVHAGGDTHAAPAAQPVLQLLSCSSLNSNHPAGRSNSSLFHLNLSNCSLLRLGSFTGTHSFSSNNDSFTTTSRPGSFTGQHTGAAATAGALTQSPGPAVGPASRRSPLPMLHESCSWGKNLDAADRPAGQQHAASVRRQQGAPPADSQHQQMLRQQQLIYLLD